MQDVQIKSRTSVEIQKSQGKRLFHWQIGIKFKEDVSKVLHLNHCMIWC